MSGDRRSRKFSFAGAGRRRSSRTLTREREENVDTWPFCLRVSPPVNATGLTATVSTLSEIMQATGLPLPKTHEVLTRAELITVTESWSNRPTRSIHGLRFEPVGDDRRVRRQPSGFGNDQDLVGRDVVERHGRAGRRP